jgi:hypothetical protein
VLVLACLARPRGRGPLRPFEWAFIVLGVLDAVADSELNGTSGHLPG